MTKKAEFIIKDKDFKELKSFYSKNATECFNKLKQGDRTEIFIKENDMAEQYVGPYVVKGMPNEQPEPSNKPPVIDVPSTINALVDTDVEIIAHITDPDGTLEDTVLTQTDGPKVDVTIVESGYSAKFHPTEVGTYKFKLDAIDNKSATTTKNITVNVTSTPPPPPPPPSGDLLWDSNRDGKWNDGNKRTITVKQGNQKPDDKSIFVAASGSPKLEVDGNGIAHLVAGSGEPDNLSLKVRSRHQAGGSCENRFGGFGCAFDRTSIDMKTESCHNFHENSIGGSHDGIKNDEWHKWRFDCQDTSDGKVEFNVYLDGKHIKQGFHNNPKDYYLDAAMFGALSWVWIRINNSDHGRIYICVCNYNVSFEGEWMFESGKPSVALRNVTVKKI